MTFIKSLKTLALSVFVASLLWIAPACAQGTLPVALVQQIDVNGQPLAGCQVYFFVAGTVSTPQNVYQDFALSQPLPNPLSCDQTGRVPMFWLANGLVHIRLTDSSGTVAIDTTMQVLGPSSGGGGGGGTVDPTTILSTGDEKVKYGTGPLTGFVRENGLTIGNATSGATERANADTQNLFVYLYGADSNLVVSGGRTGNALNDYNASKTIALPDMRGMANVGLADMGNTATSVLTTTYAGCSSVTTLGEACGSQSHTLALVELPTGITSNNASQNITVTTPGSAYSVPMVNNNVSSGGASIVGGSDDVPYSIGVNWSNTPSFSANNNISVTSNNTSGSPHSIVGPIRLKTFYIKL